VGGSQTGNPQAETSRELIIKTVAKTETADAHNWYEEQKRGLSGEFIAAVESVLGVIQRTPGRYPAVHGEVRKARLARFPNAIYFIWRDDLISVLAIYHAKRDPQRLIERLKGKTT